MSDTIEKLYSEDNIDVTTCKCPNCNGTANFDPTWQKMKCEYCGSIFDMPREETHFVVERKLGELISGGEVWHESEVYQIAQLFPLIFQGDIGIDLLLFTGVSPDGDPGQSLHLSGEIQICCEPIVGAHVLADPIELRAV